MFEEALAELDTAALLAVGVEFRALEDRAAARRLEVALVFADRCPDPRGDAAQPARWPAIRRRGMQLGTGSRCSPRTYGDLRSPRPANGSSIPGAVWTQNGFMRPRAAMGGS
jgi:hypothetical protein